MLSTSNDNQADTRIVLNAVRSKKLIISTTTDTDIIVLLTLAYPQWENARQSLMKINVDIFIDMELYCYFLEIVLVKFSRDHSIIGSDTTPKQFGVGNFIHFKK